MNRAAFLRTFFGSGNAIDLKRVEATEALRELAADVTDELERPAVLPRRIDRTEVEWFVLCGSELTLRRVQAEVQGFVGPTYGRWEGLRATLDPDDPVEHAVQEFAGGRAIRFRTLGDGEFAACWKAIKLMRTVWAQRPAERMEPVRTGAAQLRDLELALAAGDAELADRLISELRRHGLIDDENLRFLGIRRLAAQGRWRALAEASDLVDLARIRRRGS